MSSKAQPSGSNFEILRFHSTKPSNIVSFKAAAHSFCILECGLAANVILDEKRYSDPVPSMPDTVNGRSPFDSTNDPHGFKKEQFSRAMKEHDRSKYEYARQEVRIFGLLWIHCSKESQDLIERVQVQSKDPSGKLMYRLPAGTPTTMPSVDAVPIYEKWNEVKRTCDVLSLIRRINLTHNAPDSGVKEVNQMNAEARLESIRMGSTESISEYYRRFQECLEAYTATGLALPDQSRLSTRFILYLDSNRYASFKDSTYNLAKLGVTSYPPTLAAAFESASSWKCSNVSNTSSAKAVFRVDKESRPKKNKVPTQKVPIEKHRPKKDVKKCTKPCQVCNGMHWMRDCPVIIEAKKSFVNADIAFSHGTVREDGEIIRLSEVCAPIKLADARQVYKTSVKSYEILLDNQANISLFKDKALLTNLSPISGISISGIYQDGEINPTHVGEYKGFKNVYFSETASANIISFSESQVYCKISYDDENDVFCCTPPGEVTYTFVPRNGHYVFTERQPRVLISSVKENMAKYSSRQIHDADKAKQLSKVLGYPSPSTLVDMLNRGAIINAPITSHDVARAQDIYGPDLGSVRGKSTKKVVKSAPIEFLPRELTSELSLSIDIMFVGGIAFLLSISSPLALTMVTMLGSGQSSRSILSVKKAITTHLQAYNSRQFKIQLIKTDNEGAIISLVSELNDLGITVNAVGAGSHVPDVERKIRTVKDRCRSILNTLPFQLPSSALAFLVLFAVSRINMVPNTSTGFSVSPLEAFRGRKVDWKRDLRVGFGEYAEVFDPTSDNSLRPRTQAAISLLPTGNLTGTVKFLSLSSGKVITRDQFTILPINDLVINRMNELASRSPLSIEEQSPLPGEDQIDVNIPKYLPSTSRRFDDLDLDSFSDQSQVSDPLPHEGVDANDCIDSHTEVAPNAHDPEPNISNDLSHPPTINDEQQPSNVQDVSHAESVPMQRVVSRIPRPSRHPSTFVAPRRITRSMTTLDTDSRIQTNGVVTRPSNRSSDRKVFDRRIHNISVKKALQTIPDEAVKSMFLEILQLHVKGVFSGVPPDSEVKFIRSFMFLKEKHAADGSFDKLKSRLVAGGHMQDRSELLYEQISSPTSSLTHLFIVAAIAAREKRHVVTIDIGGAYLNADMEESNVHMLLDPVSAAFLVNIDSKYEQYLRDDGSMIVLLKKALYGCIESAKRWYDLLSKTLIDNGFTPNPSDRCVFNKTIGEMRTTIVVYVDDLFISSTSQSEIKSIKELLKKKFKEITVNDGKVHSYLGMNFDFSSSGKVKITMPGYQDDILSGTNVTGTVKTPATDQLFETRETTLLNNADTRKFHTLCAKLLYLAKRSRPDILLAVSFLTTRVNNPDTDDKAKMDRILKYLNGSRDLGIILEVKDELSAYADASYGVHTDGKSHSGLVLTVGNGPILVKSTKQRIVTKSSTEAELVALSDFGSDAIGVKAFIKAQTSLIDSATLLQDNKSTIKMVDNGMSKSDRTRHINIRYFWIKEHVDNGEINIKYISTDDMVADILTKPIQGDKFIRLRKMLLNWQEG